MIGEESLCAQCADVLLDRGHAIRALVTKSPPLVEWAERRDVPVVAPGAGLAERLAGLEPFDYLLSVANLRVLPDEVLALPRVMPINFHDGPLPAYAGLYCTSWALLNGEERHGVTWHVVEGGVDEGRILVARGFDVADDETAYTLNAKCYAAGIETFGELLGQIESDALDPRAQDLEKRSYFAWDRRPEAMGTLDWTRPADEVVRTVRALDFGGYPNPLAVAKVRTPEGVCLVGTASAVGVDAPGEPGTIQAVEDDHLRVACADGAVDLGSLTDADGREASPRELGLREGERLPPLDPGWAARLTELGSTLAKSESRWARRLRLPDLTLASAPSVEAGADRAPLRRDGADVDELIGGLCAALGRVTGMDRFRVGYHDAALATLARDYPGYFAEVVPLPLDLREDPTVAEAISAVAERLGATRAHRSYARDLLARDPSLKAVDAPAIVIAIDDGDPRPLGRSATFYVGPGEIRVVAGPAPPAEDLLGRIEAVIGAALDDPSQRVGQLDVLSREERELLLGDLERTATPYDRDVALPALFEAQVDRTPDRAALVFEGRELTYRELDARANQLAHRLRERGVERGTIVGLHVDRSLDLVVGMIGIQKAGGAYLPLDPDYPRERLVYMLEDSGAPVVVTNRGDGLDVASVSRLTFDALEGAPETRPGVEVGGSDLAYVIYTSGSTGRPKGVMVEHRNVVNFFAGMDRKIRHEEPGVWVAVTSASFDISVLELSWTLARGFTVLLHRDRRLEVGSGSAASHRPMDFGLCYWGNDDAPGRDKYRLLLEGAKLADRNGFHSVWTPERHFHAFGGPYANPAVSGAAVAAVTENVDVRACSCVLPLHHPIRVAEEWAMVDNMTNGRVGLGIAAGWQPDDFVLRPENTPPKSKEAMFRDIEVLRRLWRGEEVEFPKADGTMHGVVSQPRPVQPEVPIWLTIALNPKSWVQAAEIGANVLTHLLGQSIEELAEKIQLYRDRRAELGMGPGKVTLMLHTFVDADREVAREVTREPLKRYLASAASLIKQYVWMFPALKRPHGADAPQNIELSTVSEEDMDAVLEFAFNRYFEDSGLLGSVEDCVARVDSLKAVGVDEIGCLIDYGVDAQRMLESFGHLVEVVRRTSRPEPVAAQSFEELVTERGATHMQCTPSMARMLLMDPAAKAALGELEHLMVGGEALPPAVAKGLLEATDAEITNMYGPTETTIWSSTDAVRDPDDITIGRPIANTALYVLDARQRLVPPGAEGELWIGGEGVTRGYLHRPELTADRFRPDPFAGGAARMYRTGDLVRRRPDGRLDFLGRVDHQVKLRGHRIELGEIEHALEEQDGVGAAVVVARDTEAGEAELVAYVEAGDGLDPDALRAGLADRLPGHMVPARIVRLDRLPLTPNGKVDRGALPDPTATRATEAEAAPPETEIEQTIADVWQKVLGIPRVGRSESFFDLGGHSLLAVRLHRELSAVIEAPLSMTDVFRFPTVASLAEHLGSNGDGKASLDEAASRASARRGARQRRAKRALSRRG